MRWNVRTASYFLFKQKERRPLKEEKTNKVLLPKIASPPPRPPTTLPLKRKEAFKKGKGPEPL